MATLTDWLQCMGFLRTGALGRKAMSSTPKPLVIVKKIVESTLMPKPEYKHSTFIELTVLQRHGNWWGPRTSGGENDVDND